MSLRFGVLVDGLHLPRWQVEVLDELTLRASAKLSAVVVNRNPRRRRLRGRRLLFDLWRGVRPPPAQKMEDASGRLRATPVFLVASTTRQAGGHWFDASTLEALRRAKLDFLLLFGFGIIQGPILDVARLGVWSYHHGDVADYRGLGAGFWEMHDGVPATGVTLQRLTAVLDGGAILRQGWFPTRTLSYRRQRQQLYSQTTAWPAQEVLRILAGEPLAGIGQPPGRLGEVRKFPRNRDVLRLWARGAGRGIRRSVRKVLFPAVWNVGESPRPPHQVVAEGLGPIAWWPERGRFRFVADPFGLPGRKSPLLFEHYSFLTGRGVIHARGGPGSTSQAAWVSDARHASYPHLFEWEGIIYCTAEERSERRVRIRCWDESSGTWLVLADILGEVAALDPTLFVHGGRWWLAYTDAERPGDNLCLAFASSPEGPWTLHPQNPVVQDPGCARPAGPIIHRNGTLIRPAQDNLHDYGAGIQFRRITRLDPTCYAEEPAGELRPASPYPDGLHTLAAHGEGSLVDGKRRTFAPALAILESVNRLRRARW